MEDCRVALLRALAVARPTEAARLNEEADATLAARAAGQSLWGSELPPLVLQKVLELLQWNRAVCGVMRAVCSTWCSILDALLPHLIPRGSAAVMKGKLGWYQSVTEVDLLSCGADGPAEHAVAPQPLAAIDLCGVHGGSTLRRCVVSRRSPRCTSVAWMRGLTSTASPWRRRAFGRWT